MVSVYPIFDFDNLSVFDLALPGVKGLNKLWYQPQGHKGKLAMVKRFED